MRDLSEITALRGIEVSHEAIRDWEVKLLPAMDDALRKRRHGRRRNPGTSRFCQVSRQCFDCSGLEPVGSRVLHDPGRKSGASFQAEAAERGGDGLVVTAKRTGKVAQFAVLAAEAVG